jgi:CPA1 family monovalent cation:H+ antiporter
VHSLEILILLLSVVVALVAAANRLNLPYPIVLLVGGLVLGFVPGIPTLELTPDLILLLMLPPLLQAEAWFTSWREFRRNARSISLLAIGLVLATTGVLGFVIHAIVPNFPLAAAFVLGAIAAPTDAVAVAAVAERLKLPRRVLTILSGESLVNDATALVVYRTAIAAVVSGTFSPWQAAGTFLVSSLGGILIGFVVGWVMAQVLRRTNDTTLGITISLLAAWLAYLPAEELHVSGVLSVVTSGLYMGRQATTILSPRQRMQGVAFWQVLIFILNGLLFILVGMQLHEIVRDLKPSELPILIGYATLASVTVILIRIVWMFPASYLPRLLSPRLRIRDPYPPWQNIAILAWAGARGGVSLATALAVPLTVSNGAPFPQRDLILFITFGIIFSTLVLQGLSLPPVIRWLRFASDDSLEQEERYARQTAIRAAHRRLDAFADEGALPGELIEEIRHAYRKRMAHLSTDNDDEEQARLAQRYLHYVEVKQILIDVECEVIVRLRDDGTIGDEALHRVQRDLDMDEIRLRPEE